jgi:hypothetical protein
VNAIEMLKQQHREVDELFEEFEAAGEGARKTRARLCREIADALAAGRRDQLAEGRHRWNRADGLFGALDARRLPR